MELLSEKLLKILILKAKLKTNHGDLMPNNLSNLNKTRKVKYLIYQT